VRRSMGVSKGSRTASPLEWPILNTKRIRSWQDTFSYPSAYVFCRIQHTVRILNEYAQDTRTRYTHIDIHSSSRTPFVSTRLGADAKPGEGEWEARNRKDRLGRSSLCRLSTVSGLCASRRARATHGAGMAAPPKAKREGTRGAARRGDRRGSCLSSRLVCLVSQVSRLNSDSTPTLGVSALSPPPRSPLCPASQETRRDRTPVSSPSELATPRRAGALTRTAHPGTPLSLVAVRSGPLCVLFCS
jgi:hypothetical protein